MRTIHPLPKKIGFRQGDQVEVSSNEEGFVGSYYEATVERDIVGGGYLVQYKTLVKEDLSGPLRELARANEVRPRPPVMIKGTAFRLHDVVDAFDNDGWWVGEITGKLEEEDKYFVFFHTTGDLIAYHVDRLRVHLDWDWVNGRWFF